MFHILFRKLGKNREEFDLEKRYNREGSHSWAEKLIGNELAQRSPQDYKWYKSKFPELKKIRENSDYTEVIFTKDAGEDAWKRSDALINILRSNFK